MLVLLLAPSGSCASGVHVSSCALSLLLLALLMLLVLLLVLLRSVVFVLCLLSVVL